MGHLALGSHREVWWGKALFKTHRGHPRQWLMKETATLCFWGSSQKQGTFFPDLEPTSSDNGSVGVEQGPWLGCSSVRFMDVWKHSGFTCQPSGAPWWRCGVAVGGKGINSRTLLLTSSSSRSRRSMAASVGHGWVSGCCHDCLLAACPLPCASSLLRDRTLEEQELVELHPSCRSAGKDL